MKKIRHILATVCAVTAFSSGSVQAADCNSCCAPAYCDSCDACWWSAAVPIAVLVIAGVVIATTGRSHHGSSSSSSSSTTSHSH